MNPRIHEIIGTLQLLNEELQHNQGSGEVLGKIKLFSAQLYLETDMELIAVGREVLAPEVVTPVEAQVEAPVVSEERVEPVVDDSVEEIVEAPFEVETEEPIAVVFEPEPEPEFEPVSEIVSEPISEILEELAEEKAHEDLQNSQPSLFGFEPEIEDELVIEEEEIPVFEEPKGSGIELIIKKSDDESIDSQSDANSGTPASKEITPDAIKKANEVLSMFSLSRRFEFANFLFGGDMQKFTTFICEMILAQPGDDREDVFDSWYQRFDWKRRDESASDLKRNLRKMM